MRLPGSFICLNILILAMQPLELRYPVEEGLLSWSKCELVSYRYFVDIGERIGERKEEKSS